MSKTFSAVLVSFFCIAVLAASTIRAPREYDPRAIDRITQNLENRIRSLEMKSRRMPSVIVSKSQPAVMNEGVIWANSATGEVKFVVNNEYVSPFIIENNDSDDITEGSTNYFVKNIFREGGHDYFASGALSDTIICSFDVNANTYCVFNWKSSGVPPDTSAVYVERIIADDKIVWHRFTTTGGALAYSYQIWESE